MHKVLKGFPEDEAYTAVCPPWPGLTEDQRRAGSAIPLPSSFMEHNSDKDKKYVQKHVSIATGDRCLSSLYLLWVRDMNTRNVRKE